MEEGRPPTIREIGDRFHFKSTGTTRSYLKSLKQKGYIKIRSGLSRAIELTDSVALRVPILGRITAGLPDLALEENEGYLTFDDLLPKTDRQVFALKIKGESMIEKGIHDGDIAIFKRQRLADEGDIIAALIEHEATVKILKKDKSGFYLKAANKTFSDIHRPFEILGRIIAVIKKF